MPSRRPQVALVVRDFEHIDYHAISTRPTMVGSFGQLYLGEPPMSFNHVYIDDMTPKPILRAGMSEQVNMGSMNVGVVQAVVIE
jgi:hypothetical protein